ncbi:hypothetical protein L873DRAFT_1424816 [Choiromyces venosus 120613-1]|uniref:Uncharacterized protein n=1 Tax=Choiromyces venosus 120613-1 TaxID=1336337 RepID=A0A3N4J885_9PEZI|nr:hypothetical protein L873DRAFT_1424816 [Choiromyces venosus 120613-1]
MNQSILPFLSFPLSFHLGTGLGSAIPSSVRLYLITSSFPSSHSHCSCYNMCTCSGNCILVTFVFSFVMLFHLFLLMLIE